MWNPITSDFECHKACGIGEYLDIKNWVCKKRIFDKLMLTCEDDIS